MNDETKFELKVKAFKKMDDPLAEKSEKTKYVCYVQADSIPDGFNDWMRTNPRFQNMNTSVGKALKKSIIINENFHELNRGVLMSVESVTYDNKSNTAVISLNNPDIHGNIDGGHTLNAVFEAKKNGSLPFDRYIFFELLTGIDSSVDLAEARNTSIQVDSKSIEELKKSFDVIKDTFMPLNFSSRIAYSMYEHCNDRDVSPIDIKEIIGITIMFSQEIYNIKNNEGKLSEVQPIQSYSGKEASLKKFLSLGKEKREEMIKNMSDIIPDVFELWDTIERTFEKVSYKAGKRYKSRKYSKFDNNNVVTQALFSQVDMEYVVPKGIMFPLVGAFRALVKINLETGKYYWIKSPVEVWNSIGGKLSYMLLDEKVENPDMLAKNNNLWSNLFKEVYIYGYMDSLEKI